jgi:hypothetical protein
LYIEFLVIHSQYIHIPGILLYYIGFEVTIGPKCLMLWMSAVIYS